MRKSRPIPLLILLLMSLIILHFSEPIVAGINGWINLYVTNCGEETDTAYYYAEACNSNTSSGSINGSIYYVVRNESNQVVCSQCVRTGRLGPGDCYMDTERSCTFTTKGNKTITATFYESPNCTGHVIDSESTQCYFIPTLGKMLLFFLVITLVGISIYWWKRR